MADRKPRSGQHKSDQPAIRRRVDTRTRLPGEETRESKPADQSRPESIDPAQEQVLEDTDQEWQRSGSKPPKRKK